MRIEPLKLEELSAELREHALASAKVLGFVSNDALIMARNPAMASALGHLFQAIYDSGTLPLELKRLVANISSTAAGCNYCKQHTAYAAEKLGVDDDKLAYVWTYETSDLFSDAEKAALKLALHASLYPPIVEQSDFDDLKQHFSEDEIIELVGVISLFGFMNRWNSTFSTELEPQVLSGTELTR